MDKQKKIIIIVLVILLIAIICFLLKDLVFSNEERNHSVVQPLTAKKEIISHDQLVANYKLGLQPVANDFSKLLASVEAQGTTTNDDILAQTATFKSKLEELIVPEEYKDLHLNLFLSIISLEDYMGAKDPQAKEKSEKLWQEIIANNSWLKTEAL